MSTAIKDVRRKDKNVILLNAGDLFQGTGWYSKLKGEHMAKFANVLNITAAVGSKTIIFIMHISNKAIYFCFCLLIVLILLRPFKYL